MRRRMLLFGTVLAMLAMALPGSALAAPGAATCSGGAIAGGTYGSLTVTGNCHAAPGAVVWVKGDLTIAPGAVLNDHAAEGYLHAEMHIGGNVKVGRGGILGLGYNSPHGEGSLGPDTVGGNIIADHPLTLYVLQITVGGNVISNGGGLLSTSAADFRNFPFEDNVVHGNVIVQGWRGGWIGLIRNTVDGNVVFSKNVSLSHGPDGQVPGGPGMDPDSNEVMGSDLSAMGGPVVPQTIGGNLICQGNVPAAQVNPADFGAKNLVGGKGIGQCAGLTQ